MRLCVQSLASLSVLRIWGCGELWCRLQMWLGSGLAVAVAYVVSSSSDLTPSLVTSICLGCGPNSKNEKKKFLVADPLWHIGLRIQCGHSLGAD